jgi:Na+/melibiose symporter-like transporter
MFRGIINSAKNAASSLVVKYLARASVAVPFVIAAGFALAALTVMLSQRFGSLTAYWIMAGVLGLVGIVAAALVSAKERKEEVAEIRAEKSDTGATVSDAAAEAIAQTPIALLGGIFAIPGGPATALSAARVIGRNWPMAVLLLLICGLFWPTRSEAVDENENGLIVPRRPNGADPDIRSEMRH